MKPSAADQHRLYGAVLDPDLLECIRQDLATEIFARLDKLVGLDINVVGDACGELGTFALFRVLSAVCPDVLAPPAEEAYSNYNELLPVPIARRVIRQLGTFMIAHLPPEASLQEVMALAKELVNTVLGEVAPSVLEQPIEEAHALARALNRVAARLYGLFHRQTSFDEQACRRLLYGQQTPFDEYTCMELAGWVLYDIVRETCPHYLLQHVVDQQV